MTIDWFQGTVAEAVGRVKAEKTGFLVFVRSDDASSLGFQKYFDNFDGRDKLVTGLKIEADSLEHTHLMEIYHHVPVPCVLVLSPDSGKIVKRIDCDLDEARISEILNNFPNKPVEIQKKQDVVQPVKKRALADQDVEPNEPKKARIQLKLPSGENASCIMNPNDSLRLLRERAATTFGLNSSFDLAVSYPRRILNRDQNSSTLEELSLCPTSTLLILPQNSVASLNFLHTLSGFFQMFFTYVQQLWQRFFA